MKLTAGGSALNVMGEIRGGNRSRAETRRGSAANETRRGRVESPTAVFTPRQVNSGQTGVLLSVKMI